MERFLAMKDPSQGVHHSFLSRDGDEAATRLVAMRVKRAAQGVESMRLDDELDD